MKIILFVTILIISSCSSKGTKDLKRRNVDEYVVPSGVVQYFLPDLPTWANISESGKCKRSYSIRYLDFSKLKKSFSYTNEELFSFQQMFNVERIKLLRDRKIKLLGFKEEEILFYNISDKIQANIRVFRKPKFKKVHIVWIDPFINGDDDIEKLKKLFLGDRFNKGYPVFLSQCMSYIEVESFIEKHKLNNSTRILSSELLTPFDLKYNLSNNIHIHLNTLFEEDQKIDLYSPEIVPTTFQGKFDIRKF